MRAAVILKNHALHGTPSLAVKFIAPVPAFISTWQQLKKNNNKSRLCARFLLVLV